MKIVIIEDESLAAEKLTGFLKSYNPNIEILTVLDSIRTCLDWFEKNEMPDLIFSDIELLDGNVFTFFQKQKITAPIIFATAYDEFLLKAFKVNGIAYLLKPFNEKQLFEAMEKYEELKSNFSSFDQRFFKNFSKSFSTKKEYKKRFAVKTPKGIFILNVDDIAYIKADEGVVFVYLKTLSGLLGKGKKYILNHTLTELEQMLDPELFFRLNRSEMVNINSIEKMESYFNDRLSVNVLGLDAKLISAASRTSALRKWVDK